MIIKQSKIYEQLDYKPGTKVDKIDRDSIWLQIFDTSEWKTFESDLKKSNTNIYYKYYEDYLSKLTLSDSVKKSLIETYVLWYYSGRRNYTLFDDIVIDEYIVPSYSQMLVNPDLATELNLKLLQDRIHVEFKSILHPHTILNLDDKEFYLHYERVLDTWILYAVDFKLDSDDIRREIDSMLDCKIKYDIRVVTRAVIYNLILSHPYTKLINEMFDNILTREFLVKLNSINIVYVFTSAIRMFDRENINDNFKPLLIGGTLMFNIESNRNRGGELLSWTECFLRYSPWVFDELVEKTACWVPFERRLDIHNITFWR